MEPNVIEFPDKAQVEHEAWQWVIKFEGDTPPSAEDVAALNAWSQQSDLHRETLNRVANGWNSLDLLSELVIPAAPPPKVGNGIMISVLVGMLAPLVFLASLSGQVYNGVGELFRSRVLLVSVTTFTGGLAMAWLFVPLLTSALILWQAPNEGSFKTGVGEQSSFILADGSTLWLNTNSHVVLQITERSRRITLLSGEAHFEVFHDTERPFEVYAEEKMIRAIGTAFSVYLAEKNLEVMVTEGRVQLGLVSSTARAPMESTYILPVEKESIVGELGAGQKIVIAGEGEDIVKNITEYKTEEIDRKMAWLDGRLVYAGESLGEVIKEVGRYTSVKIELIDPELADIRIGGQFRVGQTEALFEVLELGFNLTVSRLSANHVQIHAEEK